MTENIVYHGSKTSGLKIIEPKVSTHDENWVYATNDIAISATFLDNTGGDFTLSSGIFGESDVFHIIERFEGAFDLRYKNKTGSIYKLSAENFEHKPNICRFELVSDKAVDVLEEIYIEDIGKYILKLEKEERIIIYKYPNRPQRIPIDDQDLVDRGILWTRKHGDVILDQIKLYHPKLLDRVLKGLVEDKEITL